MRPVILVTPDTEMRSGRRGWSQHYTLGLEYAKGVQDAGGLPWIASYTEDESVLDALIAKADGLLLSGGDFDVDPALFGEAPHEKIGTLKPDRTRFESELHRRACERNMPILGICGGMQLMNVMRGGTLWQDIDAQLGSTVEHQQAAPKHEPGHSVQLRPETRLAKLFDASILEVNSTHHQALRDLALGLLANAVAPDGIVEGFEDPALPFYVGVQWHPESMPAPHDRIYRAFVEACVRHAVKRRDTIETGADGSNM